MDDEHYNSKTYDALRTVSDVIENVIVGNDRVGIYDYLVVEVENHQVPAELTKEQVKIISSVIYVEIVNNNDIEAENKRVKGTGLWS